MNRCITLAAAIMLGCLTPAFAQELPSEGKFSITYTAVNPTPSKAVSVGDRDVTVSSSIMTAVNDAGSDQVFEEFTTDGPVTLGSPIVFKGKWLGGTGKFEGLSGEFEIRPASVLVSDTLVQGAGKKTGTYQIKKTPVAQK